MHAYPSKMTGIGQRLQGVADQAKGDADAQKAGFEKAGTGNDGFTVVSAAAQAATDWHAQVVTVAGRVKSAGGGLIQAAADIKGTDEDNERGMPVVPVIAA
ncbi:hypothetical protein Afil01_58400 [Actinorhabdospora filicis]|uniref:Uncharacterized protein n=1 Tax=Actinorhabdospora filicis TaxID=1785913 RepID=A0A9W6SRI8_9ACTN|nr:hypothetical protein [Actinorhabdospora filicis]GLZ81033.1 hypothetical protein Afil01_58400 [Actinorhabdospora filicis]